MGLKYAVFTNYGGIMSVSTYLKTIWLSTLFLVGSAFASGMSESEKASSSGAIAAASSSSTEQATNVAVPFQRTAHGLTFPCPAVAVDEQTIQKVKQIIVKVKTNTLTQDDEILKSLIPGMSSIVQECRCKDYERENGYRAKFEDTLTNVCRTILCKPFAYINYASGLLFQDLIIATKLIEAGCKNITLILVDPEYADFFKALKSAKELYKRSGDQGAIAINNAFYFCSTYFAMLKKLYPELCVTLKVYDTATKATADNQSKSAQLLFVADYGQPEEKISPKQAAYIKEQLDLNSASLDFPYNKDEKTGSYVLSDFFKLADALLVDRGIKMILGMLYKINASSDTALPKIKICTHYVLDGVNTAYLNTGENHQTKLMFQNRYMMMRLKDNIYVKDTIGSIVLRISDPAATDLFDQLLSGETEFNDCHIEIIQKLIIRLQEMNNAEKKK